MSFDPAAALVTITEIARRAADVVMDRYSGPLEQTVKGSPYDIVTEADKASEAVIVRDLQAAYPDHHIVGEEGGGMGADYATAPYRWYVDPIDGTTNFANHIPMFAISIAVTDRDSVPLAGVVYNPASGELYAAAQGHGATLNGQPIHVSGATDLRQCVLASGFAYDKYTDPDNNVAEWGAFLVRTRGLRRFGSAALDLCYVAAGRFDGYWEQKLSPWDCMAGLLMVREAGGQVSDYAGNPAPTEYLKGRVVASNGHVHQAMLDVIADVRG